jgi:SAM-dependent methyltransferase
MEARLTAPLSRRMLDLAGIAPGMRVLDLASGRGEPAIAAAHRVGPGGFVLGVDSSAAMLALARERAVREGLTNLELRVMDAEALEGLGPTRFDATLVRWGLMYMDSPVAALIGARRAMAPGGILVAAVWAAPEQVSYFSLPRRVLEKYRVLPPVDFESPGTFRYSDPAVLRRDLLLADLEVDHEEELEIPVMEARSAAELVTWTRAFGMARLLDDLPQQVQQAWAEDLAGEAEPLRRDGVIRLGGVTRIVVCSVRSSAILPGWTPPSG